MKDCIPNLSSNINEFLIVISKYDEKRSEK